MSNNPIPVNEKERLEALESYEILDTDPDKRLDNLTKLASEICEVPISLISLIDETRQWFKSRVGLDAPETAREISFCQHAILETELMQIENALEDDRFVNNILVTGDPNIRFYAGQPLIDKNGFALGTLCVIDSKPNALSDYQKRALKTLSEEIIYAIEQVKSEKARIKYERFFEMSLDILCIADTDGFFKEVNPTFTRLLGYPKDELLGKPFLEFIHPEDKKNTVEAVNLLETGQNLLGFENRYRKKDGGYVWLHWTCHPDEKSSNLFAAAHDISSLKLASQKLEISNKSLDQFAYIVSHDLKAPLRAISGLIEFLQEDLEGKLDKESIQNFSLVKNRSERMALMIDGIFEYTKAGKGSIGKKLIDSKAVIENCFYNINFKNKFKLKLKDPIPNIYFNEHQFSQIFQNLIDNSIKHHDKESGVLSVQCEDQDEFYKFTLSDDGPGINENSLTRIFEIFQSLQPKNGNENTGIGLAIVKKIIEDNEGEIRCESKLGEGSNFIFTIKK